MSDNEKCSELVFLKSNCYQQKIVNCWFESGCSCDDDPSCDECACDDICDSCSCEEPCEGCSCDDELCEGCSCDDDPSCDECACDD